ncbi:ubiquinone biosynthesis methyltransferase UbiE [Candidatus Paracaedimonas acanthamoebae]|nr:ubiquinone biosynthesis methyltransferase UbiE [Candidatus Paracaedimonas acanthamoebae]
MTNRSTTDFGFQDVDSSEKTNLVTDIFRRVASNYDLMNDVMSFGIHRWWKDQFIQKIAPKKEEKFVDVAGGTGDIALRLLNKSAPETDITICDINPAMLEQGRARTIDQGVIKGLQWVCGTAESLPFPNASFDVYTIAFGLRNVTNKESALKEAFRVLKPGGRFYCLEFSKVNHPLFEKAYSLYSFNVIPKIGALIAKDKAAYQYLVESIVRFPSQEELVTMIKEAGFASVSYQNLTQGIVAIHEGLTAQ